MAGPCGWGSPAFGRCRAVEKAIRPFREALTAASCSWVLAPYRGLATVLLGTQLLQPMISRPT
eukprot:10122337-Alexandrium_andersonii.AAC.1